MKKLLICASVAALLLLLVGSPTTARADDFFIYMCQTGVTNISCTSVASGTGTASFSGTFGSYRINSEGGLNDGFSLDASSVNSSNTVNGNTLWVITTGTDYSVSQVMGFSTTFTGSITNLGHAPSTVTETSFYDASNTACILMAGCGTTLSSFTETNSTAGSIASPSILAFTDMGFKALIPTTPYALVNVYQITLAAGTLVGSNCPTCSKDSLDAVITPQIPEPASLALLGAGLLVAGGALRRRLLK